MREKTQKWLRFFAKPFSISFLTKFSPLHRFTLLYHHIGDEVHPLISPLYPFPNFQQFENQLDIIGKHFNFLSANDWIQHSEKKGVLLSFDDGLKSNMQVAELLIKKGIPAVFFINPPFIRGENWMFRYKIAYLLTKTKQTEEEKIRLLQIYEEKKINYSFPNTFPNLYLNPAELLELSKQGFEIGAHSQTHPLFELLTFEEQKTEFSKSIIETEELSGKKCRMFAFPFSDHGVKSELFNWISKDYPDIISFGTAGAKKSKIKNHDQRIPIEKKLSITDILKTEILGSILSIVFFLFLFNPFQFVSAQQKITGLPKHLKIKSTEADSLVLEKLKIAGYQEAYLSDSSNQSKHWNIGPRYFYSKMIIHGGTEQEYKAWKTAFSFQDWEKRAQKIVEDAEKEGYAFAELKMNAWNYEKQDSNRGVFIEATLNPGRLIVFDSIIIPANIREKPKLIYQYLRIRPGMVYNPELVQQIPVLLNNSTWFKHAKKPELVFSDSSVKVILDMKNARANQFDVLVGLLPPKTGQSTFQFTVLADIHLISAFRRGEEIGLKYEKLPGSSQKLQLNYRQPYPFRLPVTTHVHFELWKQDTLFLNRSFEAGAIINPGGLLRLKFSWQNKFSTLLSSAAYRTVKWPPPPVMNTHANAGIIGFILDSRDDRLNPKKGVWLQTDAGLGARVIRKTLGLDSLDYSRLTPRQIKTEAWVKIQKYTTIAKRHIIVLGAEAYRVGLKQYFDSDARYFGGAYSLRGFNENQFQATSLVISTLEYRFWLEQRSFLGIFADFAWFEQKRVIETFNQQAMGAGLSLAFDSPAGMIQVAYAIGMTKDSRFQPSRGRVHVGLINQF